MLKRVIGAGFLAGTLSACGEQKVSARNEFPVALITSHSDGDLVADGEVTVIGSVSDPDDGPEVLVAHWLVDGVEACPASTPDESGTTRCVISVTDGAVDVQLQVKDPLNAVGADRLTLVVEPTDPPSARVVSPAGGVRLYTDEKVTFEGVIRDTEDDVLDLEVAFESDIQPDLDLPLTVDSDGTVTGFGYLNVGEHAIALRVRDTDGKTASDSVVVRVGPTNSVPACEITAPEDGALVVPSESVMLRATIGDADQPASSLNVAWASDADGPLSTASATTDGTATAVVEGLSAGTHIIGLTVVDEREEQCTDSVVIQVGTAPTITIESPSDGSVVPYGVPVPLAARVSDVEDASALLTVVWRSDLEGSLGSVGSDSTGFSSLDAALSLGTHILEAETVDTHGLTARDAVTVQVDDVPVVSGVTIAPSPAYAGDGLNCAWTFADATGVDASTARWSMEGVDLGVGASMSGGWVRDNVVTCTVTPHDGVLTGVDASASITVSNTLPSVSSVSIVPVLPRTGDPLTCLAAGFADADGDLDESTAVWSIDGVSVGTGFGLPLGAERGQTVVCTVTPHDGVGAGVAVSASVDIANGPPAIVGSSLSPASPTTLTPLVVSATTSDPDGDAVTVSWDWLVNGVSVGVGAETLPAEHFVKGDSVRVVATPNDGFIDGTSSTVGPVVIGNSPPGAPLIDLEPTEPTEGLDPLLCSVSSPGVDPDGDAVSHSVSWQRDGVPFVAADTTTIAGDTVPAIETLAGEIWQCEVEPTDGMEPGPTASASVEIKNAQTRVFVTSEGHSTGFGGPAGADAACTDAADAAGLGGTWTAFISGGGATAISRVADGPYVRMDGELIAEDRADLSDGNIRVPINITEWDTGYSGFVCTGSSASGTATGGSTASGGNCAGWTRDCGVCFGNHWYVTVGRSSDTNDDWVDRGWNFCGSCRLYCFED